MPTAYKDLTHRQLDWCIAKLTGRALRSPRRGTDADAEGRAVPFRMYETVATTVDGKTTHTVAPLTVTRFGVAGPGASLPTISFVGSDGRAARGSMSLFFVDREEAELEAQGANRGYFEGFHPTTNPAHGLPIRDLVDGGIELKRWVDPDIAWRAQVEIGEDHAAAFGPTELIAFARAFVRRHMGDMIEVPADVA
jgi:hypothetical protein